MRLKTREQLIELHMPRKPNRTFNSFGTTDVLATSVVVVVTLPFAVLVEDESAADQGCAEQERPELLHLVARHGAPGPVAFGLGHLEGSRQQLGQGDEDEGPGTQQENHRDVGVAEFAPQGKDDNRAQHASQGGQEVEQESLCNHETAMATMARISEFIILLVPWKCVFSKDPRVRQVGLGRVPTRCMY